MPRRRKVAKREILPDPQHHSETLTKFMNVLMNDGKKSAAERIVYGALDLINEKNKSSKKVIEEDQKVNDEVNSTASSVLDFFEEALNNVRPTVEVRSRRVGGATYQVPVEVRSARGIALAMRWVVQAARGRGEKGMMRRLAGELMDAYEGKGTAVEKRRNTHKMAQANQAFAHFRWN